MPGDDTPQQKDPRIAQLTAELAAARALYDDMRHSWYVRHEEALACEAKLDAARAEIEGFQWSRKCKHAGHCLALEYDTLERASEQRANDAAKERDAALARAQRAEDELREIAECGALDCSHAFMARQALASQEPARAAESSDG